MLNLLEFKAFFDYGDGIDSGMSGAEAYQRYAMQIIKLIDKAGGKIVFDGQASTLVIGDGELEWDSVGIVEYRSVAAFIAMTLSQEY